MGVLNRGWSDRTTALTLACTIGLLTLVSVYFCPSSRLLWILGASLSFLGVLFFDLRADISKTPVNAALFLAIVGMTFHCLLNSTVEAFWKDVVALTFLYGALIEFNIQHLLRKTALVPKLFPAVVVLALVTIPGLPDLHPIVGILSYFLALVVFCFMDVLYVPLGRSPDSNLAWLASLRFLLSGLCSLFYMIVFGSDLVHQEPLSHLLLVLPLLGLILAGCGFFLKHERILHLFQYNAISVFVFWVGLSVNQEKLFLAFLLVVIGAWVPLVSDLGAMTVKQYRQVLLKFLCWNFPGSIVFTLVALILVRHENPVADSGAFMWLLTFIAFWINLKRVDWTCVGDRQYVWKWRHDVALFINSLGGPLLAVLISQKMLLPSMWGYLQ